MVNQLVTIHDSPGASVLVEPNKGEWANQSSTKGGKRQSFIPI